MSLHSWCQLYCLVHLVNVGGHLNFQTIMWLPRTLWLLSQRVLTCQTSPVLRSPDGPRSCSLGAHSQCKWEPAGPFALFLSNILYSPWSFVADHSLCKKISLVFNPRLRQRFCFLLFEHVLPDNTTVVFTSHGSFFLRCLLVVTDACLYTLYAQSTKLCRQ